MTSFQQLLELLFGEEKGCLEIADNHGGGVQRFEWPAEKGVAVSHCEEKKNIPLYLGLFLKGSAHSAKSDQIVCIPAVRVFADSADCDLDEIQAIVDLLPKKPNVTIKFPRSRWFVWLLDIASLSNNIKEVESVARALSAYLGVLDDDGLSLPVPGTPLGSPPEIIVHQPLARYGLGSIRDMADPSELRNPDPEVTLSDEEGRAYGKLIEPLLLPGEVEKVARYVSGEFSKIPVDYDSADYSITKACVSKGDKCFDMKAQLAIVRTYRRAAERMPNSGLDSLAEYFTGKYPASLHPPFKKSIDSLRKVMQDLKRRAHLNAKEGSVKWQLEFLQSIEGDPQLHEIRIMFQDSDRKPVVSVTSKDLEKYSRFWMKVWEQTGPNRIALKPPTMKQAQWVQTLGAAKPGPVITALGATTLSKILHAITVLEEEKRENARGTDLLQYAGYNQSIIYLKIIAVRDRVKALYPETDVTQPQIIMALRGQGYDDNEGVPRRIMGTPERVWAKSISDVGEGPMGNVLPFSPAGPASPTERATSDRSQENTSQKDKGNAS